MARVTAPETLYKKAVEVRSFTMDFSSVMSTGETISSSSLSSERIDGSSSDLTLGTATDNAQDVVFTISGGINGRRYRVRVNVTTSASQVLEGDGVLVIRD